MSRRAGRGVWVIAAVGMLALAVLVFGLLAAAGLFFLRSRGAL